MACVAKMTIWLLFAVLVCHVRTGDASGCRVSDIHISLVKTGKMVEGQPEYRVTVANACACPQAAVNVRCFGLPSVEAVDKSKIRTAGDELCVVAGGGPIVKGSPVTFTYAWKTPQELAVVSAKAQC